MIRRLAILGACLFMAACSGGGGSSNSAAATSTTTTTTTPAAPVVPALTNFTTVVVDAGPPYVDTGPNAYTTTNSPFVSVTICAPGSTTNCQTIDHVLLDTGSVGLRIFDPVINASLLSALTNETDPAGNPVGECYGFVDGYIFGSVRLADFKIGGESVSGMPMQVIGDVGQFAGVPTSCSTGGGDNLDTVPAFGANGVLGVGVTTTDCGTLCTNTSGSGTAIYYDCPATGCSAVVGRTASTAAPFQQLPNPVAAMSVDNNGTILSLPAPAAGGSATVTGTLFFGIGTQTNNALGSATVLTTTTSTSRDGSGLISATYNGANLSESYIDSGSNIFFFVDRTITPCTGTDFLGYYCPASPLALSPTLTGRNGMTASGAFTLYNAKTLLSTNSAALPGVGGNPDVFDNLANAYPSSFDFGLPFFYGRNIYTAIEGMNAGGTTGPYFAY